MMVTTHDHHTGLRIRWSWAVTITIGPTGRRQLVVGASVTASQYDGLSNGKCPTANLEMPNRILGNCPTASQRIRGKEKVVRPIWWLQRARLPTAGNSEVERHLAVEVEVILV